MLNVDPPATAGGTDRVQVQLATFEAKLKGEVDVNNCG